jgi:hypothetical protein
MAEDFVPEGYRPLMSAVDRFAQALQMSIQSAQLEIRAKLHSELIRAAVLRPDTGELLGILSRCWATETAVRWFESGTCLLPDENGKVRITAERFDMFYRPENAAIFVLENDLQRLIDAKLKGEGARVSGRRIISNAEAKNIFEDWRKSRGDNIPSLAEDYNRMKQFGVSRDRVKELRRGDGVVNLPRGKSRRSNLNRRIK